MRISMTLRGLIWESFGAPFDFSRFIGAQKGLDSPCWQILAKVPVEQDVLRTANPAGWNGAIWNGVDLDTMRMSLRSFLVDRFNLAAHLEDRPIDGYALAAAGSKLKKANPANRPSCKEGPGDDGKDPRLTNPVATRLMTLTSRRVLSAVMSVMPVDRCITWRRHHGAGDSASPPRAGRISHARLLRGRRGQA